MKTKISAFLILALLISNASYAKANKPLNVLMIAIDDMNNWIGVMEHKALTPNIDAFAGKGMLFDNAYCVVPACNPSRTALMTGLRPETTKQYGNEGNFREKPNGDKWITLAQFLQKNGYETVAAGKIFHHPRGTKEEPNALSDPISWNEQRIGAVGTPNAPNMHDENGRAKWLNWSEEDIKKYTAGYAPNTGMDYISKHGLWGPIDIPKEKCGDWQTAEYCAEYLKNKHDKPFFLACGIFRPHSPQFAPKEYFDMYPLDKVEMPITPEDDMDDIPDIAKENWSTPYVKLLKEKGMWRSAVQSYMASCTFADDCVGQVIDALEKSEYAENTIVVLWTDHGWQLGHKNRWEKFSLWHQATNSPLIIKYPEMTNAGQRCSRAVSFLDLYPTFCDLLHLNAPKILEGQSLKPLLENPTKTWDRPALITYPSGNYSVAYENWNYIHYIDGSEELYDHKTDPDEFHNIAHLPENKAIIEKLRKSIPPKK